MTGVPHVITNAWRIRRRVAVATLALMLGACTDSEPETVEIVPEVDAPEAAPAAVQFDTATLAFITSGDTIPMTVEIAERPDQRAYGLMDRDALDADAGMIFLYDQFQHQDTGFWMYRTRMPLDIAYFDGAGRIVAIRQMMPCTSLDPQRCTGYSAGVPFFGAVEANRGYFARSGIGVDDRVVLPGRVGS